MLQGLQDTNAAVRASAAWSLCLAPSTPETIDALRKVLADDNDRVRASAIWTLSHIGGKAVLPDVVRLATNDASGIVRFRAVWGLAFIHDKSALPIAITALGDYDPDDAKLAAAGFDAHAPATDALKKLAEIRASVGEVAFARGLGNIADPAAAAILAGMETSATGVLRREIRRALFKLRQRGIDAPVTATSIEHAAQSPASDRLTALFSPIDGEGARIIWITKPRMQGGVTRLWGLVSESDGLVGAIAAGLSRKELKSEREELESRAGMRMIEGDPRLADFILCEAYRRTPEARRARVGNFLALRTEIIAAPVPTHLAHPIYDELGADIPSEPALDLLEEPELLEWRLTPAEIRSVRRGAWPRERKRDRAQRDSAARANQHHRRACGRRAVFRRTRNPRTPPIRGPRLLHAA